MVQSDISQISRECNNWREALRQHKQEFTHLQTDLQDVAAHIHSKHALQDVEHYHNQFHIQLINIHDLKQAIKLHDRRLQAESSDGSVSDETLAVHENLYDQFQSLENTLQELRSDFNRFKQTIPVTA